MTPGLWRAQLTGKEATHRLLEWNTVSGNSSTSGTATEAYTQFHLVNILGFSFPSTRDGRQNTRH